MAAICSDVQNHSVLSLLYTLLLRVRSRETKDDIQSATHRQIWLKRVCVARQQETLDAGHGERSILAHPVNSDASALRRGRASFGGLRLFVVGSNEAAEAERAQSVIVGLDRLSKRTEHVADLIAVCAHCCVNKYASVQDKKLCNLSVAPVDRNVKWRVTIIR